MSIIVKDWTEVLTEKVPKNTEKSIKPEKYWRLQQISKLELFFGFLGWNSLPLRVEIYVNQIDIPLKFVAILFKSHAFD